MLIPTDATAPFQTIPLPSPQPHPKEPQCQLLGPVSIVIQSLMALIVISSLVLKRYSEKSPRPWKVWIFDVSKQVLGAMGVHFLNVVLSLIKSKGLFLWVLSVLGIHINGKDGDQGDDDECKWYFISLFMDTTIGVPILYVCLLLTYQVCYMFKITEIESGNYGNPPRLVPYVKQLMIFIVSLAFMKGIIFLLLYFPVFMIYAEWVLSWSDHWPNLQIFLVMLVFPVILNCFQYYVIDNIIKFDV
ncbi:hypothetical protein WICPIJ_005367 [Wickerhamomyces pijperi]|uniref:Vacuolar membrane protein n=1 Tax=Wickerhamomyces pijperi TaxID=599730 RepID=A0A9P8Q3P7_WICPI|nr:hypothetical protein WICPIJ_005367 [Wickerhamomyces pijperi]